MRLGVDIGGTFTDLVLERDGILHFYKTPTTADNPRSGVMQGLHRVAEDQGLVRSELLAALDLLVHGTTIATNALLTGQRATTAFLTTDGHPDILVLREAGRMGLPQFDHRIAYPKPYVPRALTFELPERIDAEGKVVRPLDEAAVIDVLEQLPKLGVEAVGVSLLWSIANPVHERRVRDLIQRHLPGMAVSLSHEVNPCLREYRRASATCIDASLKPLAASYLDDLETNLREAGFAGRLLISTSTGSVAEAGAVAAVPIHLVRSGPALSPVAAAAFSRDPDPAGLAIVIDAGGTTLDVSLLRNGRPAITRETWIGQPYLGHMTGFPSVDVRSIGAGGGSIAAVGPGRLLTVGPDSAGAVPGPACYGQGGQRATVTDAALVLGFLDATFFQGPSEDTALSLAGAALLHDVGEPLGVAADEAAEAVLRIFVEEAAGAIEDMTVRQGIDPRGSLLLATGGAAGLVSVFLARRLGCDRVLVPPTAAVNCAAGGLMADLHHDVAMTCPLHGADFDTRAARRVLADLEARCRTFLASLGGGQKDTDITFSVEAKYDDQNWEVMVPVPPSEGQEEDISPALVAAFHREHQRLYRHHDPDSAVLFITWHARATVRQSYPWPLRIADPRSGPPPIADRLVRLPGEPPRKLPVVTPAALASVTEMAGPFVIQTPLTSIVVDQGACARVSTAGAIVIDI